MSITDPALDTERRKIAMVPHDLFTMSDLLQPFHTPVMEALAWD